MKNLKDEYELSLKCDTCGGDDFDTLQSGVVKCNQCSRTYRDEDDLISYNKYRISKLEDQLDNDMINFIEDGFDRIF